jgi:ATP adenylyltransferase
VLYRGEKVFVVMNLYPYNNGHLMIVPYREEAEYDRLERDEQIEIALILERCIRWLRAALKPDGFNVGFNLGEAAGAGIPRHLHMHVVPRWRGDTNFMPTIAEVKVVPEALSDTYQRLIAAIREEEMEG